MKLHVVGTYILVFVFVVLWQAPLMAQSVSNQENITSDKRVDELVAVMKAAVQGFGKSPDEQSKLEEALRKTADFCAKHHFPTPVGIDIGLSFDAGFVVGGLSGVDLVYMIQKDGNLGIGLFSSVDAQLGLGASAGGDFAVSLVFDMNSINDYVGSSMGVSGAIAIGGGTGLSLNLGITLHDFENAVKTFKEQYHKDGSLEVRDDLGEWLKTLVAPGRSYTAGLGLSFGVSTISTDKGWTFKSYEKSLPFDLALVQQEAADVHEKLHQDKEDLEKYLIPAGARSDLERAKGAFEQDRERFQ